MKIYTPYPFDCAEISSVPDRDGAAGILYRKHMLVVCGGSIGNNETEFDNFCKYVHHL